LRCGDTTLLVTRRALPAQASWAEVETALRAATGEKGAAEATTFSLAVPGLAPSLWRGVELREPDRLSAAALWVGGDPDRDGIARRLWQARANLFGGDVPPFIFAVAAQPRLFARAEDREDAKKLLRHFLQAQKDGLAQLPALLQSAGPPRAP
jgi:hypothetical protein